MARIWYLCQVSGLQSWICVSSKLDFLEHVSPKWWLWCWYVLHFLMKQSTMKNLRELLRSGCPLRAEINGMNCEPGKKRPTSLRLHGSSNLCFLSILGCNFPIPMGVSRVNSLFPTPQTLHQKFHLDLPKCPFFLNRLEGPTPFPR